MLVPLLAWFAVFVYYPLGYSIWASLHAWIPENPGASPWVGLDNYRAFGAADSVFRTSLLHTAAYVALKLGLAVPLGFGMALLLRSLPWGTRLFTFCVVLPSLTSAAAIGTLFVVLYQPTFGVANDLLTRAGLPAQGFLSDPGQALASIALVDVWQSTGFVCLILYAGLINIPALYFEAARVDGAGPWATFWRITLPLLARPLAFVSVITLINAFQVFDLILIMSGGSGGGSAGASPGGPGDSTYVLSLMVFVQGLAQSQVGPASAVSVVLLGIVLVCTIAQFRILRPDWEY